MNMRFDIAQATGALSTWALKNMLHRPAANFPGKAALYIDPQLIFDLRARIHEGSIVVVGTNGKTTVTNLLADAFEAAGKTVVCNRTGANLDSGVATALLQIDSADWGVFESDELWLAKVTPQLKPDFIVLLNLFRDQLDRMGEIDHIQQAIASALSSSPSTTFIYNADDPFCQAVAELVENDCVAFGFEEDLNLAQNTVADASICQRCESILAYEWRQYGQLGSYHCPNCNFHRLRPSYAASDVALSDHDGASRPDHGPGSSERFGASRPDHAPASSERAGASRPDHGSASPANRSSTFVMNHGSNSTIVNVPFSGTYMLYNALAVCAAADCCNLPPTATAQAIRSFAPQNGRLQRYVIDGRNVLLNLAKNPTGFNQNLRIVTGEDGPKAVAFFINDKEADGHDVSWLWDVDFQELSCVEDLVVFAGGTRRNDMQVRLKYAGIDAGLVDGAGDFLAKARAASADADLFLIANYTALPDVKAELDKTQRHSSKLEPLRVKIHEKAHLEAFPAINAGDAAVAPISPDAADAYISKATLTIVHMYPELLNLYGDGGNVTVLAQRARARGLNVNVVHVSHGQKADLESADIVFLGGGPDREQHLASRDLLEQADDLRSYVEDDGVLLAICGGYQILGREWLLGDESVAGLSILDMATKRAEGGSHNRLVGNIALESPLATMPVIGYENHAGRTFLGSRCSPFGRVIGKHGKGNNDEDGVDGARYRNVLGTYLHGPLLSKNPEIADWLIERAIERRAKKIDRFATTLAPLDDSVERAANEFMCKKLSVSSETRHIGADDSI